MIISLQLPVRESHSFTRGQETNGFRCNMPETGVLKIINICLSIMERENGLLLVDEIESGLHYSMYKKIWELIGKYSREKNCQVVATTHSKEMMEALFDTDNEVRRETNIYTIYKYEGKNIARIMSAEEAENAVDHLGMELR